MVDKPSGLITSGKFFRLSILGEIPAQMAQATEQEIAQSFLNGVTLSLSMTGLVQGFNFEILAVMPELPQEGN